MTRENRLWAWLSKAKPSYREALHMTRVENSVGQGTPDVEGQLHGALAKVGPNGGSFWIELKVAERPKRADANVRVKFQPYQVPWLTRRDRAGGNAHLLIQVGSGRGASRYLVPAARAREVEAGVAEDALTRWSLCDGDATAETVVRAAAVGR
jgi:hypothetical protein